MFIHVVLFEIDPKEVAFYRADSRMWARYARQAKGFVSYHTMKRYDHKDHYASVYEWRSKADHDRFMKKYHDWLVEKSRAKVRVEGYYNLKSIDRVGVSSR
jgi:heme-degrading monooxygenase HmoA